jgi:ATP-dependent RNA helicase DeaD
MTTDSLPSPDGTFADLGLRPELLAAVEQLGYEEPTPIQREAVPVLLQGQDLLGLAATGTGKTAAFALPLLQGLRDVPDTGRPAALVLVPTRELAIQVAEAVHRYGRDLGVRVLPIYGGSSMGQQLRTLRRGVDVVVATPGRALDHLNRGTLQLDDVRLVVLDEADEMLDMGFQEDLEAILGAVPAERQTALFSATFPKRLRDIAARTMRDPVRIEVAREEVEAGESPRIRQMVYVVRRHDKRAALCRVLDMEAPRAALVFCRTRLEVEDLTEALQSRGYAAEALHGGLSQAQRDRAMGRLRSGGADVIIATDVAARGIDIEHLTHVVNYDVPAAPEQYTHRIGRTGRAGREGTAITFLEPRERRMAHRIEQLTGQKIESAHVPSAAALRARRLNVLGEQVREAASSPGLDPFRAVCDSLSGELTPEEIAAAALRALHRASWNDDLEEIPSYSLEAPPREKRSRAEPPRDDGEWTRLFIGLGRRARLRAGDLLGAILNETELARDAIGRIEIAFNVSFVEVRPDAADTVIDALRRTTLRGRKVNVRRDRGPTRR